jgi:hypothetical protein
MTGPPVWVTDLAGRFWADTPVLLVSRDSLRGHLARWHRHLPAVPPH